MSRMRLDCFNAHGLTQVYLIRSEEANYCHKSPFGNAVEHAPHVTYTFDASKQTLCVVAIRRRAHTMDRDCSWYQAYSE